jgi:DNA segregation ATPase FtsK/SpoIIIE-like protein
LRFQARGVIHVMTAQRAAQRTTTMTTFTIDTDNNITAHATAEQAAAATSTPFDSFSSQPEFAELAKSWPAKRLVAIWSSLPGVQPVKKFQDHKAAARRIWERIQGLGALAQPAPPAKAQAARPAKGGARAAQGAPAKGKAGKKATTAKKAPTAKKSAPVPEIPPHAQAARRRRWWPCCNARTAPRSRRLCRAWDGRSTRCAGSWRAR